MRRRRYLPHSLGEDLKNYKEQFLISQGISKIVSVASFGIRAYVGPCVGCAVLMDLTDIESLSSLEYSVSMFKRMANFNSEELEAQFNRFKAVVKRHYIFSLPPESAMLNKSTNRLVLRESYKQLKNIMRLANTADEEMVVFNHDPLMTLKVDCIVLAERRPSFLVYVPKLMASACYYSAILDGKKELADMGLNPSWMNVAPGNFSRLVPALRPSFDERMSKYFRPSFKQVIGVPSNVSSGQ